MQPLAIFTMLITGLSLTLGMLTLSTEESSSATSLVPARVEPTTSVTLSIECGPSRLAEEFSDSTIVLFAFGMQPATTSGLPDLLIALILLTILCSVVSLTEQVTIRLRVPRFACLRFHSRRPSKAHLSFQNR